MPTETITATMHQHDRQAALPPQHVRQAGPPLRHVRQAGPPLRHVRQAVLLPRHVHQGELHIQRARQAALQLQPGSLVELRHRHDQRQQARWNPPVQVVAVVPGVAVVTMAVVVPEAGVVTVAVVVPEAGAVIVEAAAVAVEAAEDDKISLSCFIHLEHQKHSYPSDRHIYHLSLQTGSYSFLYSRRCWQRQVLYSSQFQPPGSRHQTHKFHWL